MKWARWIKKYIKKVKCTVVQALRLCTGRTAHRGSRGIALLFLDQGSRRGWGVSVTLRPLLPPEMTRYPLYRRLVEPQGQSARVRTIYSFYSKALEGGEGSASRSGRFYLRERPGTHCTGGWLGLRAGLDRCGKPRPPGIRSPDLPARSQSLKRLRYPAHKKKHVGVHVKYLLLLLDFKEIWIFSIDQELLKCQI